MMTLLATYTKKNLTLKDFGQNRKRPTSVGQSIGFKLKVDNNYTCTL